VDKSVDDVDNLPKSSGILGIFAKEPVSGQVKTRLSPPLSPDQAAELYQISLRETVDKVSDGDFDLTICYAGDEDYFRRTFPGKSLYEQSGGDLGVRMSNALQHFFRQGYQQAVLIGSDSPDLPLDLVKQAFSALERQQLVMAPAHDGGYVLIGESCHSSRLFENISWSSSEVLSQTQQIAEATGIKYQLLPAWDDLDDLDALRRFLQRSPESRAAEYLCSLSVPECLPASV